LKKKVEEEEEKKKKVIKTESVEYNFFFDNFLNVPLFEDDFLDDLEKNLKLDNGKTKEDEKEVVINFPETCVAVWSLDGTLQSANKDFIQTFRIPSHLVNFSKYGPHYKKIIHNKNISYVSKIFDEIFSASKASFIGEVELSPFVSDFDFTTVQPVLNSQISLNLIFGKNFSPKYVVSYITLL